MREGILLKDVKKSFRNGASITSVLKGVSITVQAGQSYFIVGPSGCGKTTLLSVLCGTLMPDEGDVTVLGHDLMRLPQSEVTRFRARYVGFVFQQFNLIPTLSVADNVGVPLQILGKSSRAATRSSREMLERVGLGDKWNLPPRLLSGGQQQRVAIARALVHRPALVVCDEPTSALDSETGRMIMELLREEARQHGQTVIVVTHDPRIYHLADQIAEMEDGRIRVPAASIINSSVLDHH